MKNVIVAVVALVISSSVFSAEVGKYTIGHEKLGVVTVSGVITALHDSKVKGVTCHTATVQKSISFVDPSDSSVACRQTGPISIGNVNMSPEGEDVQFQGADKHFLGSFFKDTKVRRIYDQQNNVLIYVTYTTKVINSSYKQSISTISLYGVK